ncbi:MAG: DinB family protein, partial [Planctomycetota bacterium]|nr:DinB family protein [Planctomycetota bacterium]
MSRLQIAIDQIISSRQYTNKILETIDNDDWFRMSEPAVTHIAWQVGHIAVAQYGLALVRMRGEHDNDEEFIPEEFRDHFTRASVPNADP